jgi:hypothetical protein
MPASTTRRTISRPIARFGLLAALAWSAAAPAVDQPSTYPGCATRNVSVAWGGSVTVDLASCHSFGLGVVSTAPAHGSATPAGGEPVNGYTYHHQGAAPAGGGSDRFVVRDDNSDLITVNVTIAAATSSLAATPAELPGLQAGSPVDVALGATGGSAPYAWRLASGTLPKGLRLSADGRLTGTPTERGAFSFGLRLQDARDASATQSYGGIVQPAPMRLAPVAALIEPGLAFSQALTITGGLAPHRFALEPGPGLPAGITLSGDGVLSGTSTAAPGDYPVTLRVTDASTGTGPHFELETVTLTVAGPPSVNIAVSPAAVAEDGGAPLVFTVSRGVRLSTATVVNLAPSGVRGAPASITIPPGAAAVRLIVTPTADTVPEPDEAVVFRVAPGAGYTVGAPARAAGIIRSDDEP